MPQTKKEISPQISPQAPKKETSSLPSYYVAVGASAGGLEAIEQFFKNMKEDSGMAFVVIQHLSPTHKSMMTELIARHTKMAVHRAEEGMKVEANNIYLIPPNNNLSIFHGALLLTLQDHSRALNLPIDIFFKSLAEDQEDRSIAIILSGTGSDGTRGLRIIKEKLGMVMVQDEESSKFDGMPKNAIATGLADFILSPDEMPHQLLAYAEHPYANQSPLLSSGVLTDEEGLTRIFFLLREKGGIDFTFYKPKTIVRRIERRILINQLDDLNDYVHFLESNVAELNTLYREMLIGVTNFFRDTEAFDLLREEYIPEIIKAKENKKIRVWVAASSTGEEAYSIAILFRECATQMGIPISIKIFATDVDRNAVVKSGNGIFPKTIVEDVPEDLLKRYFFQHGEDFHISRSIREMVVFAEQNLFKDPPFTNMDLITCRNMLIYVQPVLQRKAMELFNFSLNPDAILFLGSSETTGEMNEYFQALNHKWKFYRSRGNKKKGAIFNTPVSVLQKQEAIARVQGRAPSRLQKEEQLLEGLLHNIAEDYALLALVVNEQMELQYVSGNTEGFFKIPSGKIQNNITKMAVKELSIPLATGIQRAFTKNESIAYSNIKIHRGESSKVYTMKAQPLPRKKGQEPLVTVFLKEEVTVISQTGEKTPPTYDAGKEAQQRVYDLEMSLQFHKENLQATVEELETSNEELQATNEELMASNEELQSTNEELQSVNEELYTVNAEYQNKIVELTEVNNDLENLYSSTQIASIFLDENLDIRKYTPALSQIYKIIISDVNRPFSHLSHLLENVDPFRLVTQVQNEAKALEQEVRTKNGDTYLMRILPYQVAPDVYSGVILNFIEINAFKETQLALERSEKQQQLINKVSKIGTWDWNLGATPIIGSEMCLSILGWNQGSEQQSYENFLEVIHPEDRAMVQEKIAASLEEGEGYNIELRILWNDGSIHWVLAFGDVIRDSQGKATRMLGIVKEITHWKKQEELYKKEHALLQSVFNTIQDSVLILDEHWIIKKANQTAIQQSGFSKDTLLGQNLQTLIPKLNCCHCDFMKTGDSCDTAKERCSGCTLEFVCHDGSLKNFHISFSQWFQVEEETLSIAILREAISPEK